MKKNKNQLFTFALLALGLGSLDSFAVDAVLPIQVTHLPANTIFTVTTVVGTADKLLGEARTFYQISGTGGAYTLTVKDVDDDQFLLVTVDGLCGAFTSALNSKQNQLPEWEGIDIDMSAAETGCANPIPIPTPSGNINKFPPGKTEVRSSPFFPKDDFGRSNRMNEAAVRSVLIQFGIENPCQGICKKPAEKCRPVAMVLNSFRQGGTLDRKEVEPSTDWAKNNGMKVWSITPAGEPPVLSGTLYCGCLDPTQ